MLKSELEAEIKRLEQDVEMFSEECSVARIENVRLGNKNETLDLLLLESRATCTRYRLNNMSADTNIKHLEEQCEKLDDEIIDLKIERTSLIKKLEAVESIFDSIAHSTNTGLQVTEL
jgi:hypothetical protein